MIRALFGFIFFLTGWKVKGNLSEGLTKCVLIIGPHTSYWDFYIGVAARSICGFRASYLVKKELFAYQPVAWFLRITGGISIDRHNSKINVVDMVVGLFDQRDYLVLALAPEGTRKKVATFKTGFYRIAHKAQVPIVIVAFDFGHKEVRFIEEFHTTGNMEKDIEHIMSQYHGIEGLHPDLGIG